MHSKLKLGWSPYQIEGRLKLENENKCIISHESIYHYIYSDMDRRYLLHKHLRRKHPYRIRRGQRKPRIPNELMIGSRPEMINNREEFGHWECDLMVFKKGKRENLITLRERKSRYLVAIKNQSRESAGTALAIISTIKNIKHLVKSITFDQGSEFKKYPWIRECLNANIYFCEPASPHQKGAVENSNAVLRLTFQRDCEVEKLKQRQINCVVKKINNRPMKCLDYLTPQEILDHEVKNHKLF